MRRRRNILKITAWILGSIAAILIGFHFWFIYHAEQLLEELVESQSHGKVKLHVKKFKFNWFSHDMQLRNAVFYSTDTTVTSYHFSVERIHIRVNEIFPFIFEKKMVFDSLNLLNPDIRVTRLKGKKVDSTQQESSLSLTQEMGKVYNSIQEALQVLKVKQFVINNGKFTLSNKASPDELPVTITNIHIHLDNLRIDTTEKMGKQRILFSDNVAIQTHNQDIFFPDGRHRISFADFRINIGKKMVEFDSCTIAATKGDSARASFKIFFDKLQLTNIDFDTLYQKEVIKADSVYCINPQFRLDVELEKRTGKRKPPPKLNDLIQQLTGDLQLAFVVVNNASFDINTIRDDKPSSFTSDHNNFEIQGLRIEKSSPEPLTVKSFAMAIRNYENFLRDSSYAMQFDSVLLFNNSIYLSNFSVKQLQGEKVINSFSMPQFELRGLSWEDLLFERKLAATKATLYHPVINYSVPESTPQKSKQDVFQALAGIGTIIQLNDLDISDGKINVNFKGGSQLQLENASMALSGKGIIESGRINDLQESVRELRFKKGSLKLGSLVANMENAAFTGKDGRLTAATFSITSKEKNIAIKANGVAINSMQLDNQSHITEINGIRWQEADIRLTGKSKMKEIAPGFVIRNISGANTNFTSLTGHPQLSAFFETISADEFLPMAGKKPRVTNLAAKGRDFLMTDSNRRLSISRFQWIDHQPSVIMDLRFTHNSSIDSISAIIPSLSFSPDINSLVNGSLITDDLKMIQPVIRLQRMNGEAAEATKEKRTPEIVVGRLSVQQPDLYFNQAGDKTINKIEWRGKAKENNSLELTNFRINHQSTVSADQLRFSLNNFSFTAGGKKFDAGKGEINSLITDFYLEPIAPDEWDWRGNIKDLSAREFVLDSIGKKAGKLEIRSAKLNDLSIDNSTLLNYPKLIRENTLFHLKEITGNYSDKENHFSWWNASYDKKSKTFSLDSFTLIPALDKESFMAIQKYQADYMTIKTGPVSAGPFDLGQYLEDTTVNIGVIKAVNVSVTSFRDKRLPFKSGTIKSLPTSFLRKIPVRLSADSLRFDNGHVEYTEWNEKTNLPGIIAFTRLNARAFPITNYDKQKGDSLHIDASGYLLDSVRVSIHIKESFTDPAAGFLLRGEIGPADIQLINPIVVPLASVKLESGFLDTLNMTVTGDDRVATGEIKMFYHDLKIKLLNNKNEKKQSAYKGFASFLANTFLIKNNNSTRTGTIYFERLPERSPFNYLAKIALNGIGSSIGIKNNKKLLRNYKKELRKRNL